jgi:hypothetical protein
MGAVKSATLRRAFARDLLVNLDVWIAVGPADHLAVPQHWSEILIAAHRELFLAVITFIKLMDAMRLYCWYTPVEGCDPQHQCAEGLCIAACREILFDILFQLSVVRFTAEDFSALIDHCVTLSDNEQQLDLLAFVTRLVSAIHEPLRRINDCFDIIARLHLVLYLANEATVVAIVHMIVAVHAHAEIAALLLFEYLEVIIMSLMGGAANNRLFKNCFTLLLTERAYKIFQYCARMASKLGETEVYRALRPSPKFVSYPHWVLYSVTAAAAMSEVDSEATFTFLVRCDTRERTALFQAVRLSGDDAQHFLKIFILHVLGQPALPPDVIAGAFELIRFHLFFRERKQSSDGLTAFFGASPFADAVEPAPPACRPSFEDALDVPECEFGIRIGTNIGAWADASLAMFTLKLAARYRTPASLHFGLAIAMFLLLAHFDYGTAWLHEVQLTAGELAETAGLCVCPVFFLKGH